jgi:hypothetical protein
VGAAGVEHTVVAVAAALADLRVGSTTSGGGASWSPPPLVLPPPLVHQHQQWEMWCTPLWLPPPQRTGDLLQQGPLSPSFDWPYSNHDGCEFNGRDGGK